MKSPFTIDKRSGRISTIDGALVFDPEIGPPPTRLGSLLTLFEGAAEDEVRVTVSFFEMNGGCVVIAADHSRFGAGPDAWTEANERARLKWLTELLRVAGAPVGSYSWGKVEAIYNPKTFEASATVSYRSPTSRSTRARAKARAPG